MICLRAAAAILAGILFSASSFGIPLWKPIGPGGGDAISAIALASRAPSTLYAAPQGVGVFRSQDAGVTWSPARNGLPGLDVSSLIVDPRSPLTIYAGTSEGFFVTLDGGANWAASNSGLPGLEVTTLAIDSSSPDTLYAGIAGSGLFKSRDGGRSWAAANAGIADYYVATLIVDPTAPATLYAGMVQGMDIGGGVFQSTDGGSSWSRMNGGLPEFPIVIALALDPKSPATLYAGGQGGLLYKTTDGARTWTPVNAGFSLGTDVSVLLVDPESSSTIYAGTNTGFFRSNDRGLNWSLLGLADAGVLSLAVGPDSILYAGTNNGVFESRDGGNTWVPINAGLAGEIVQSLAIDPASSSNIYVGTPSSFFATAGGGATWSERNAGLDSTGVVEIHIDPVVGSTLYAVSGSGKAFKTGNSGLSWTALPIPASVRSFDIDPLTPSTLYAATDGGVFRSLDAGLSWITSNQGLTSLDVDQVLVAASSHATIYAGTQDGVFRSLDGGGIWTKTALPPQGLLDYLQAVDPRLASIFYVADIEISGFPRLIPDSFLFRTVDGGASWAGIGDLAFLSDLAIDPERPAVLYAVAFAQVWSGNVDAGGDWRPIGGLPGIALKLALDPARPSRVYVGTSGNGVFQADVEENSPRPVRPAPRTVRFRAPAQD